MPRHHLQLLCHTCATLVPPPSHLELTWDTQVLPRAHLCHTCVPSIPPRTRKPPRNVPSCLQIPFPMPPTCPRRPQVSPRCPCSLTVPWGLWVGTTILTPAGSDVTVTGALPGPAERTVTSGGPAVAAGGPVTFSTAGTPGQGTEGSGTAGDIWGHPCVTLSPSVPALSPSAVPGPPNVLLSPPACSCPSHPMSPLCP